MRLRLPCLLALWMASAGADAVENPIRINSVGFLPGQEKQASIAVAARDFSVLRVSDGSTVLHGSLDGPNTNEDTGETLFTADFGKLVQEGIYQLDVPGVGLSPTFRIAPDVYREPLMKAMRAFSLWRCGTAVRAVDGGEEFAHGPCHLDDAWLDHATGKHERVPSTGGWHDAGDYNKYVVNAGVTVGVLLRAWEDFQPAVSALSLGIPRATGAPPDFLAEVKWELDWLFTMQDPQGAVYHKLSTLDFGAFIPPDQEKTPRYLAPPSTEATANFVGMMAAAARAFEPLDSAYADRCRQAAARSYAYLSARPERIKSDQSKFSTGPYEVPDDGARLWAAAEMWELTGDPACLRDFEERLKRIHAAVPVKWDYSNPGPLGCITYLFSKRGGRDENLVSSLRANLLATAERMVAAADAHGYRRPTAVGYGWGFNGQVARQSVLLHAAHRLDPRPHWFQTTADAVGYLFGRNVHGRSYVTGLGHQPPQKPHDRSSASDGIDRPWPGFLVGGPHPGPRDWSDDQEDFRTNEIAINWNSALVYALAWLDREAPQTLPNP